MARQSKLKRKRERQKRRHANRPRPVGLIAESLSQGLIADAFQSPLAEAIAEAEAQQQHRN